MYLVYWRKNREVGAAEAGRTGKIEVSKVGNPVRTTRLCKALQALGFTLSEKETFRRVRWTRSDVCFVLLSKRYFGHCVENSFGAWGLKIGKSLGDQGRGIPSQGIFQGETNRTC